MPVSQPSEPFAVTARYLCQAVHVEGLPTNTTLESGVEYFIAITIDERPLWNSTVCEAPGGKVTWQVPIYRSPIQCSATVQAKVMLFKVLESEEFVKLGEVGLSVREWLDSSDGPPHALSGQAGVGTQIQAKLALTESGERPIVDKSIAAGSSAFSDEMTDSKGVVTAPQDDLREPWLSLMAYVQRFQEIVKEMHELHPFAKMALFALSEASKIARHLPPEQTHPDILQLLETMQQMYSSICNEEKLRGTREAQMTLGDMTKLAIKCASFLSVYFQAALFSGAKSIALCNIYQQSLEVLALDYRCGSRRYIEHGGSTAASIETIYNKQTIQEIPYVHGAGYQQDKRCLPGTRTELLDRITEWALSQDNNTPRAFFLIGPAGTGKSTIAHTIASRFDAIGQLGSIFCFNKNEATTRKPASLFRNVARDLCHGCPTFQVALANCLEDDSHTCGTRVLSEQFEKFLLRPLRRSRLESTVLIVVDALDESGTVEERAKLLSLLWRRLKELPHTFRFLVTSREELDISSYFQVSTSDTIVQRTPSVSEDRRLLEDIRRYVQHGLEDEDLPRLLAGLTEADCLHLAKKAEGNFQWAFIACRYIRDSHGKTDYVQRYQNLIARADDGLDGLYDVVLSEALEQSDSPDHLLEMPEEHDAYEVFRTIMGYIVNAFEPLCMSSLRILMTSAGLSQDTDVVHFLRSLGSLVSGVGVEMEFVRPLHSSFRELLRSPERLRGRYFIGANGHQERLAIPTLTVMGNSLHFNMGSLDSSYILNDVQYRLRDHVPEPVTYACKYWSYHLSSCKPGLEEDERVTALIRNLFVRNLLYWIEVASLYGFVSSLHDCISRVLERLQSIGPDIGMLASDTMHFVRRFAPAIRVSAPHVYLSAFLWTPQSCLLRQFYGQLVAAAAQVTSGGDFSWPPEDLVVSGHKEVVGTVAFSPDGSLVASGARDNTIRVWNADSGELARELLYGHTNWVEDVEFSPDGRTLVSGSLDHTVRLWSIALDDADARSVQGQGHTGCVNSVSFSPAGDRFVSGSLDSSVRIWNASNCEPVGEPLVGHSRGIQSATFTPNGQQVISCSDDYSLRIWDVATGQVIRQILVGFSYRASSVECSLDGAWIVSGCPDGTVRMWSLETGNARGEPFRANTSPIVSASFSPDASKVLAFAINGSVSTFHASTGEQVGRPLALPRDPLGIAWSKDGKRLAFGCSDSTARIWDVGVQALVESSVSPGNGVFSVAISPDGSTVAAGYKDGSVMLWDSETGEILVNMSERHQKKVNSVAFSPDGLWLASGSHDHTIRIWEVETGNKVGTLTGHVGCVYAVAFSPDGEWIVSASGDLSLQFWHAASGEPVGPALMTESTEEDTVILKPSTNCPTSVAFSPDGQRVVSGSTNNTLRLWDAETGELIGEPLTGHESDVDSVAFSPDGRCIVSGSMDQTVRVWDAESGAEVITPILHPNEVRSAIMSPNNRDIVSACSDRRVHVWDSRTGQAVTPPIEGHTATVNSVAVSRDGQRIISGSADSTIRIIVGDNEKRQRMVSTLSLSPRPEHQLTQPYVPSTGEEDVRVSFDWETGWIMGNKTDHLLWVPPDMMHRLYTGWCELVIPGPTVHVNLGRFVHGTRWTEGWRESAI